MTVKMRYCAWCGEELGVSGYSEPDHCGQQECARQLRGMFEQEREEAIYAAQQDDYERYR